MMRVRRNAFAAGKNGDASATEAPSSLDYSHDEVFDMVPSSHGMVLQSDAEGVESASPSCSHLTEVQVQGIKITLSTSSRANISMCFLNLKNTVNQRARISFWILSAYLARLFCTTAKTYQENFTIHSFTQSSYCPWSKFKTNRYFSRQSATFFLLITSVGHFVISFFFQLSLFTENNNNLRRVAGSVVGSVSVCQKENILHVN